MSDSFPPEDEGPDPYEGQDLDGLLSGAGCPSFPEALRPVLPALDALRAPPTPGELRGEAAARAYFRKVTPAREARTVLLPTAMTGGRAEAVRRPHSHRRPPKRGPWRSKVVAGTAAAVVVIAGAAAAADTLASTDGHPATVQSHQATSATVSATSTGVNEVQGKGTPTPVKPAPTTKTSRGSGDDPSPSELCDEYVAFLTHPERYSPAAARELFKRLSSLTDGRDDIEYYCRSQARPWAMPQGPGEFEGMPEYPFSDGWPGQQGDQGSQRSQDASGSAGRGKSGSAGGGNTGGQGGNDQGGNGHSSGTGSNGQSLTKGGPSPASRGARAVPR